MVSDRVVGRTAHAYIEQFCEEAAERAAARLAATEAQGDRDDYTLWTRVVALIEELRS